MVEDATGRGYTVRIGTKIGNNGGKIVSIEEDRINVVETTVDFTGEVHKNPVVMNLQTGGGDITVQPKRRGK